jgi:GMP synthase (glutamine-hydrolysing)
MPKKILVLDFGSQYTQLIARSVRSLNVYCEIRPFSAELPVEQELAGIILSGSPASVHDIPNPVPASNLFELNVPILGICYGAQWMASSLGGRVERSAHREYGRAHLKVASATHPLFKKVAQNSVVWMSHGDAITALGEGMEVLATTDDIPVAAFSLTGKSVFGLQFHPEVHHSEPGVQLLNNFVKAICGCEGDWTADAFIESEVARLQREIGSEGVLMGLSGGVDSTVAATLLHKAVGDRLQCIFVDNGLLRKDEAAQVMEWYRELGLPVKCVDASSRFLHSLEGISDPEEKRKRIGGTFIEVFEEEALKIPGISWLGQGTIYPDVIESVSVKGPSVTIKSHHNVGGLPERMNLKVVEPLRMLFKDDVRKIGAALEIPARLLERHPFPGPGLGIRILGEVTAERVRLLQEADSIFIKSLQESGLYASTWQAGVILLPVYSVGVMGDERSYEQVAALRAVTSVDGMTADWAHLPYDFLGRVSNRIINRVKGINRVVYDISSKPPATIEWE